MTNRPPKIPAFEPGTNVRIRPIADVFKAALPRTGRTAQKPGQRGAAAVGRRPRRLLFGYTLDAPTSR